MDEIERDIAVETARQWLMTTDVSEQEFIWRFAKAAVELEYALKRAEQIRDEARVKANEFMQQRERALALLRQRDANAVFASLSPMSIELSPEEDARAPPPTAALIALLRGGMTQQEVTDCLRANREWLPPHALAKLMAMLMQQHLGHGLLTRQFHLAFPHIPLRALLEAGQWSAWGGHWSDEEFDQFFREWLPKPAGKAEEPP